MLGENEKYLRWEVYCKTRKLITQIYNFGAKFSKSHKIGNLKWDIFINFNKSGRHQAMCFFLDFRSAKLMNASSRFRLPNTLRGGIWSPKNIPKTLKHQTSGGIWKTRDNENIWFTMTTSRRRRHNLYMHVCLYIHICLQFVLSSTVPESFLGQDPYICHTNWKLSRLSVFTTVSTTDQGTVNEFSPCVFMQFVCLFREDEGNVARQKEKHVKGIPTTNRAPLIN